MPIIDPQTIVAIFDDENKSTSTVLCKVSAGLDKKGVPLFRSEKHTIPRKEADAMSNVLLKKDKAAADLRDGLKPGPRKR